MARRSLTRKAYPGLWSFPGGHVEKARGYQKHSTGSFAKKSVLLRSTADFSDQ